MSSSPSRALETVPNPARPRPYVVRVVAPEFTCLCPKTGQPDFATFVIEYTPDQRLIELKSLKLYFWSFREEGAYHEAMVNRVLDDLVAAADPQWMRVAGFFKVRGGITTTVLAEHGTAPKTSGFPAAPAPHEA